MAYLIQRVPWTGQPSGGVTPSDVALALGVEALWLGSSQTNLHNGRQPSATSGRLLRVGIGGQASAWADGTANRTMVGVENVAAIKSYLLVAQAPTGITANKGVMGPATSTVGFNVKITTTGAWRAAFYDTAQRNAVGPQPSAVFPDIVIATVDGTTGRLYVNGAASASVSIGTLAAPGSNDLFVGASGGPSTADANIRLYAWAAFRSVIDLGMAVTLSRNPWRLFA